MFAAILAREIARILPGVDYRALGAMAFIGLGTVWAQGLSGSAAVQVSNAISSPPPVQEVVKANGYASGTIPLSDTIFLWQSIVATLVVFAVAVGMAWLLAPTGDRARTAEDLGITLRPLVGEGAPKYGDESGRPGGWLVNASSEFFFPPIIAIYSCILGVFVPSGGSKWVIEAPYVLDAAN